MKLMNPRRWNNGKVDLSAIRAKRVSVESKRTIKAPAADLFRCLTPALLSGWTSEAPKVELMERDTEPGNSGFSWRERITWPRWFGFPEEGGIPHVVRDVIWYTTLLDRDRCRYHALLAVPGFLLSKIEIEMEEAAVSTSAAFSITTTVVAEMGERPSYEQLERRMGEMLAHLADSIEARAAQRAVAQAEAPLPPVIECYGGFESRSALVDEEIFTHGDADLCFRMACPVEELRWIDDWRFDLVCSESGYNELHNIFREEITGLVIHRRVGFDTYWYTVIWDTDERRFHAVLLTEDSIIGSWEFSLDDLGGGRLRFHVRMTLTGLNSRGNEIIAEIGFEKRMRACVRHVLASAKHKLENKEILRVSFKQKVEVAASLLRAVVGRCFRRLFGRSE